MKTMKRFLSVVLVLVMFFGVLPITGNEAVAASSIAGDGMKFSENYKNSKYYSSLRNISLTSDPASDIVSVAYSQVGYWGGNFAGTSSEGSPYTEYMRWFSDESATVHFWCCCLQKAGGFCFNCKDT